MFNQGKKCIKYRYTEVTRQGLRLIIMSNPLYVLVKVGIAPIPTKTFESKQDDLHETLRREYPSVGAVSVLHQQTINVSPTGTEVRSESVPILSRSNISDGWAIRIMPDAIFLQTNKYTSYLDLRSRLERVLGLVHEVIDITHYQFAGIRYVNKYPLGINKDFDGKIRRVDFLQPELCNLPKAGSNLLSIYFEGENQLRVNSGVTVNNPPLNADLAEFAQELGMDMSPIQGACAHVDLDAHCQLKAPAPFNMKEITETIDSLRLLAKNAYLEVINQTE